MRIAIDTGGTFTDCVFVRDAVLEILKVPSTPRRPADAIGAALKKILAGAQHAAPLQSEEKRRDGGAAALDLTCGTTVGTNALLERRGGRIALITTAGFEDVLEIGRQARPRLYDFFVERPAPLVPRERRYGLRERVTADGIVLRRPSRAELRRMVRIAERCGAGSVAVCLLFSFANPAHERAVARALRSRGFEVSVSHEILPEFREFERTATTVVNAYLVPVVSQYLAEISGHASKAVGAMPKRSTARAQVRIMQSSGGIISAAVASREPVRTILSGPAGGILGAQYVAELAGDRWQGLTVPGRCASARRAPAPIRARSATDGASSRPSPTRTWCSAASRPRDSSAANSSSTNGAHATGWNASAGRCTRARLLRRALLTSPTR